MMRSRILLPMVAAVIVAAFFAGPAIAQSFRPGGGGVTDPISIAGNITTSAGNIIVTLGNITASNGTITGNTVVATQVTTDGLSVKNVDGNGTGHIKFFAALSSTGVDDGTAIGAGTCTSDTLNADSNNQRGRVTTTCTAGQTAIVTWGSSGASTYTAAPYCLVTAANAAGAADLVHVTASTTALTITSVGALTAAQLNYFCFE